MDQATDEMDETEPLELNQDYVATQEFEGQEAEDLPFKEGEIITIVRPAEMVLWYVAQNAAGKMGTVPATFLTKITPVKKTPLPPPPPIPSSPALPIPSPPAPPIPSPPASRAKPPSADLLDDYERMGPAPTLPPKSAPKQNMTREEKEILKVQEKERIRRLTKGTLIIATAMYEAEREGDLSFTLYEEAIILEPLEDLGWYYAQKADNPAIKGVIPITHFRLVYMSDDDEEDGYKSPVTPAHDRLYDDITDFISTSGWFYQPGMPQGKNALLRVLSRKANMELEAFMAVKEAVYIFRYHVDEKIFVGKATVLHEEIMKHFECFGMKRKEIREIDDELCHHTDSAGWELTINPIEPGQVLEVEWAKCVIMKESLSSSEEIGANECLKFTSMNNFDKFWEWLSPN